MPELWQEIQQAIYEGMGIAGEVLGPPHDLYRPAGAIAPLAPVNLLDRLPVAWNPDRPGFRFNAPGGYGKPTWQPLLDGTRVCVGDYLVRSTDGATWFIAAMQPLLPVLAVACNTVVSVERPGGPAGVGALAPGGENPSNVEEVLSGFPASLLIGSGSDGTPVDLPGDPRSAGVQVFLPAIPGVEIRFADIIRDDLGRRWKVGGAEVTDLGWRVRASYALA